MSDILCFDLCWHRRGGKIYYFCIHVQFPHSTTIILSQLDADANTTCESSMSISRNQGHALKIRKFRTNSKFLVNYLGKCSGLDVFMA